MSVVIVNGVPMVPAHLIRAVLDTIESVARDDYEARANDLTVPLGTRLVDIHAEGMREAAEWVRAVLAAIPEEQAGGDSQPGD
jgi:hypothetical protein